MSDIDDELFALAGGDEEAEEGEASSVAPGSPDSLGSGAMDESDSEDGEPPSPRDCSVPYPLEGKYINEADKRHIEALPQLERERILGERAEESNTAKFAQELARRAKEREVESTQVDKKKRKAASLEPEDSQRKSSRQKVKTSDKLEAYKRVREQRGQFRERQNNRRRRGSSSDDIASDRDADGESDAGSDDNDQGPSEEDWMSRQPADAATLEYVHLNRRFCGLYSMRSGFNKTVVGMFVRVGVGQDESRRTIYKMAKVVGVKHGKGYLYDDATGPDARNGASIQPCSDQWLTCQHGKMKKDYNFTYLSNQRFTTDEIASYKQSLASEDDVFPTVGDVKAQFERINKDLVNRDYTPEEEAYHSKRIQELARIRDSIKPRRAPVVTDDTQKRLAAINLENRKKNIENTRKALVLERQKELRERKAQAKRLAEERKAKEAEQGKQGQENAQSKSNATASHDLFNGSPADNPEANHEEKNTGKATFRTRKLDDDIIGSIDLGIDIDI